MGPRAPCVLIPGGGGPAAICAIRSLRRSGFAGRIVASDPDPLSPGLLLADAAAVLPPSAEPSFWPRALELIDREGVKVVLPTSGFDTQVYADHADELARHGVIAAMSSAAAIRLAGDKWLWHEAVHDRLPLPLCRLAPDEPPAWPCFVKPRSGKGTRGARTCRDRKDLAECLAAHPDLLLQELLPGAEYSVDVLSDMKGRALCAIPRERLQIRDGITTRGRVRHEPEIQQLCLDMANLLGLRGPSCHQLKRDAGGRPKFLEVNPRIGGASIFSTLAGADLITLTIELALGRPVTVPDFREITVVRLHDEMLVNDGSEPRSP